MSFKRVLLIIMNESITKASYSHLIRGTQECTWPDNWSERTHCKLSWSCSSNGSRCVNISLNTFTDLICCSKLLKISCSLMDEIFSMCLSLAHDKRWPKDSSLSSDLHNRQLRDLYLFLKLVLFRLIEHLIRNNNCFSDVLNLVEVRYGCGLSLNLNFFVLLWEFWRFLNSCWHFTQIFSRTNLLKVYLLSPLIYS